ncbi:MAG: peptidoglycan DD-metalloendopeptidase family protein [Chloroflexota bacterium]
MLNGNDTKGRFRLSLDFGPLQRLFRTGIKPRTLLITALALFLIIATVYAAIAYPTLFRPPLPETDDPGQFGPGSTDRTCVPTAGADGPAVPVSTGGSVSGPDAAAPDPASEPAAPTIATPPPAEPEPAPALTAPTKLAWPLRGKTLAGFGIGQSLTLGDWRQHDGIDIQAAQGASVVAAAAGIVTVSEKRSDIGVTVVIDHGGGITTTYGCLHVTGRKAGDRVNAGDEIGKAGNSGMSEVALENHLHFEVRRNGEAVDPADWLK